ncbi:14521_t:CDS:2, partial [Gigaspora rosea]
MHEQSRKKFGQNEPVIRKKIRAYLATEPHIICSYQRIIRPLTNSVQTSPISMPTEHKRRQYHVKRGRPQKSQLQASTYNQSNLGVVKDVVVLIEYNENWPEKMTT